MEEKVLIVSQRKKKSIMFWIMPGIVALLGGFILMELATQVFSRSPAFDDLWSLSGTLSVVLYIVGGILVVVGLVIKFAWGKCELTVTTKRVYGVAAFNERVDLPLDSITAVGTSIFSGIAVTTASGAIKFALLENRDEMHNVISKLLIERQNKSISSTTTIKQEIPQSNADELKKFKDLLDSGIISQEEFDAKKKQLLGL